MKVNECMCHDVLWVNPGTSVCDCANLMAEHKIGCIPVCDENQKVVGIITDRDILLRTVCKNKNTKTTPASDIMSTNVKCCSCNDEIEKAEDIMAKEQVRRIPVVDNNKVIGILTLGDLANYNEEIGSEQICDTLENICECGGQAKNNY